MDVGTFVGAFNFLEIYSISFQWFNITLRLPLSPPNSKELQSNAMNKDLNLKGLGLFYCLWQRSAFPCNRWYIVGIRVGMKTIPTHLYQQRGIATCSLIQRLDA